MRLFLVMAWSSLAGCAWSERIKALLAKLGASSQDGLAELVCSLDDSVAFSIVELLDLVARLQSGSERGPWGDRLQYSELLG